MVAIGNNNERPIVPIPEEGTLDRLLYDAPGRFGFFLKYEGDKEGVSFSRDGVQEVIDQIHKLLLSQTMRRWNETKEPPQKLWVEVAVHWDGIDDSQEIGTITVGKESD